jgi:hypothetical protein
MNARLREIHEWVKQNTSLLSNDGIWEKEIADLQSVADQFRGCIVHTGGGIVVAIVPVSDREVACVGEQTVALYRSEHPEAAMEDIFWNNNFVESLYGPNGEVL